MFLINLKIALRNLRKNLGFSFINIGGLALGMACCLLLLLYVNYEWSYDKQFKDKDRIYVSRINLNINGRIATTIANPDKLSDAARQSIPAIENATRMAMSGEDNKLFSHEHQNFKLNAPSVDPSFLQVFNYDYVYGDAKSALSTPESVVLTESTAKKLFGNENPLGQTLKFDRRKLLKVSAVVKDQPKNQSIQYDALLSWSFYEQEHPEIKNRGWGTITCWTFFKLKDKNQFDAADAALRKIIKSNDPNTQLEAFLFPLTKFHLYNDFSNGKVTGGRIDQVRLFLFLAFCVLLIACINYMNLSTARSEKRAREVGIRKALGSRRQTLVGQFILESMVISMMAVLLAFGLLELALPYFNNLLNISMSISYGSYQIWMVLAGLILLTGFLAGSYPAFYLSSFIPVKVLKGPIGTGKSSLPVRKILVVLQFSLSICMIICAIIVYTQTQYMKNKPLGFAPDNLVQMDLEGEWKKPAKLELLKDELKKSGAISSSSEFAQGFTKDGSITGDFSWPGKEKNDNSVVNYRSIGYEFSSTIGAEIVKGRDFSPKFVADTSSSILINQALADKMGIKDPVGIQVRLGDNNPPLTIVGVLKNYSNENLGLKSPPTFFYYSKSDNKTLLLRLNPAQNLSASINKIKDICQSLNPEYPVELSFVNADLSGKLEAERLLSVLSNFFGGFAIFISCLGLLGLALYMAEQRKKEISIRKVLGADLKSILILLNTDFIKLVFLSNLIAFPVAFILVTNWLKSYDYKISVSAMPFALAALMSLTIALLTVSLQSFKVAKANAVDALKYE